MGAQPIVFRDRRRPSTITNTIPIVVFFPPTLIVTCLHIVFIIMDCDILNWFCWIYDIIIITIKLYLSFSTCNYISLTQRGTVC